MACLKNNFIAALVVAAYVCLGHYQLTLALEAELPIQDPAWRYLNDLLQAKGSREPAENVALLSQEYDRLEEELVELTNLKLAKSENREPGESDATQHLFEAIRQRTTKLRRLILLSQNRMLESPAIGQRRASTRGGLILTEKDVKAICNSHEANMNSVLSELGWTNSFELSDGKTSDESNNRSNLRAYIEYYIRHHYARCPRGLYLWLVRGLSRHQSGSQASLSRRADDLFGPLEATEFMDTYESILDGKQAEMRALCTELRSAIGYVIKIYDTNEMFAGKPYLDGTTGNLLHRWQLRYHLCLPLIGA